ncbi:DUF4244 domain-containing protein [Arthrobacter wenxiniae]|jgi:hypothetical protein|uniref:DUF4244 domain-containing protein n=1 Tax=Arthrobacter wenxiniae TaxID=2713570 RepID=A0A7Y7IDJ0_9MICC|nr:DUF4244 domain-containing protein [Arthrobacter wenxiniae]NVM93509.1 DUF4244 domain-containing protein [Arthrobacter wenxiniae]
MYRTDLHAAAAAPGVPAPHAANVREIFPGASKGVPVANPPRVRRPGPQAGMATAEYAIATLAAVGFAGLLVVILKSDEVRGFLLNIIRTALSF